MEHTILAMLIFAVLGNVAEGNGHWFRAGVGYLGALILAVTVLLGKTKGA